MSTVGGGVVRIWFARIPDKLEATMMAFWRLGTRFRKSDFLINMRSRTITCPAGLTESFVPGDVVEFNPTGCDHCPLRAKCTPAAPGHGRKIAIAHDERLQHRLRSWRRRRTAANA